MALTMCSKDWKDSLIVGIKQFHKARHVDALELMGQAHAHIEVSDRMLDRHSCPLLSRDDGSLLYPPC